MKKIILIIVICLLLFSITGCTLQEYQYADSTEYALEIDGVLYGTQPATLWRPLYPGDATLIGKIIIPGTKYKIKLYIIDSVEKKMFAMSNSKLNFFGENAIHYYYRHDIRLPSYDSSGVDTIGFREQSEKDISNIIHDRDIIEELFDLKENAPRKKLVSLGFFCSIIFMNSEFEGMGIDAGVFEKDRKYWIEFEDDNVYTEISQDLLEKIAGRKLPTAEEIQRQWDAED